MATAVPDPMTLDYARGQLEDALQRLEEARSLSSASGQGRSVALPSVSELSDQVRYWTGIVRRLRQKAAGARAPGFRTATWA